METLLKLVCIAVGCSIIGSEYTNALGWGLFLILIALD